MSEENNKNVIRQFFGAFEAGDLERVISLITDDFTWWVPPTTIASGTYSKSEWVELISGILGDLAGPMTMQLGHLTAEDDRVSVTAIGNIPLNSGKIYSNHYHILFWLRDGKISVGKEYQDTYHVGEIFGFPSSHDANESRLQLATK